MKNTLDDVSSDSQPPPPKRIKLETDDAQLLSGPTKKGNKGKKSNKASKLEKRALGLLQDPRISAVEPQQVMCRMCGHWVKLFKHTDFSPANWNTHAEKCEMRSGWKLRIQNEPGSTYTLTIPAAPPTPQPKKELPSGRYVKTSEERRIELEADERAGAREAHRVFCKLCGVWVRLHNTREYDLWNWTRHADKCQQKFALPAVPFPIPEDDWSIGSSSATPPATRRESRVTTSPTVRIEPRVTTSPAIRLESPGISPPAVTHERQYTTRPAIIRERRIPVPPAVRLRYQAAALPAPPASSLQNHNSLPPASGSDYQVATPSTAERESRVPATPVVDFRNTVPPAVECEPWNNAPPTVEYEPCSAIPPEPQWASAHPEPWHAAPSTVECEPRIATPPDIEHEIEASVPPDVDQEPHFDAPPPVESAPSVVEPGPHAPAPLSVKHKLRIKIPRTVEPKPQVFAQPTVEHVPSLVISSDVEPEPLALASSDVRRSEYDIAFPSAVEPEPQETSNASSIEPIPQAAIRFTIEPEPQAVFTSAIEPEPQAVIASAIEPEPQVFAPPVIEPKRQMIIASNIGPEPQDHAPAAIELQTQVTALPVAEHEAPALAIPVVEPESQLDVPDSKMAENSQSEAPVVTGETGEASGVEQRSFMTTFPQVKVEAEADDMMLMYPVATEDEFASASSRQRRKGRSVEERRQSFLDDPRCGEVRPHEVFCLSCKKWIKLYKEVAYIESNWVRHIERCSVRISSKQAKASSSSAPKPTIPRIIVPKPIIPTPLSALAATSASSAGGSRGGTSKRGPAKNVEQRLQELQSDSRVSEIQPNQVLCGVCKQWIKLQVYREYDTWNWRKHIPLCEQRHSAQNSSLQLHPGVKLEEPESEPSLISALRTATSSTAPSKYSHVKVKDESSPEERREELERDGRCERIEPHRVFCKLCMRQVGLHVKKDYSLSNWYRHVKSCSDKAMKAAKAPLKTPLTALGITRAAAAAAAVDTSSLAGPSTSASAPPMQIDLTSLEGVTIKPEITPIYTDTQLKNADERKNKLLTDPRIGDLEPTRVLCKLCQRWLKLSNDMEYAPYNWYKHISRCEERSRTGTSAAAPIVVKEQSPEVQLLDVPPSSFNSGRRKRFTAAERLERLQTDSRIKTIEKHRAQCGLCNKWVKLQNKTEYDPHNWFAHIKKCEIKARPPAPPHEARTQALSLPLRALEDSPMWNDSDSASCGIAESLLHSNNKGGHISDDTRRQILETDTRSSVVERHRVLCGICQQWIKLRDGKDYVPYNWFKHKNKCERKHALPRTQIPVIQQPEPSAAAVKQEPVAIDLSYGSRKKSDEDRAAELRADPRLGDVEPGRVFCRMCNNWIKLNMATGYLPSNWLRHAQRCQRKSNWQGELPSAGAEPPELQAVEVIDLESDSGNGVFGYIELGHLVSAFEPSVSSTDYGVRPSEMPEVRQIQKETPIRNIPTLRARNSNTPTLSSSSEPKISDSGKRMHRTEESRKEELKSDPRTSSVLPNKILCGMCDHWIQMRRDVAYSPQNWLKHAGICEVRSGWLKKANNGVSLKSVTSTNRIQKENENELPYNARIHMEVDEEEIPKPSAPLFKPVDWEQEVVFSDDEDEDEDEVLSPGIPLDAEPTVLPVFESGNTSAGIAIKIEEMSASTDLLSDKWKTSTVPTPLTLLRASKAKRPVTNASASSSALASRPKKTPSKSPSASATPTPFTTVPLPLNRPSMFSPVPFLVPSGALAQPTLTSTPLSSLARSRSQSNTSNTPTAPDALDPGLVPVMPSSIAPHLHPHPRPTPMPPFGQTHLFTSPAQSDAPHPVQPSPVTPSATLPTPPATASTSDHSDHSHTLDSATSYPFSSMSAFMSPLLPTDHAKDTVASVAAEPASVARSPTSPALSTSVPGSKNVKSKSKARFATSPHSFGYGPVKPGVLQLAPTPAPTATSLATPSTPTAQFDTPDVEMGTELDFGKGSEEPMSV